MDRGGRGPWPSTLLKAQAQWHSGSKGRRRFHALSHWPIRGRKQKPGVTVSDGRASSCPSWDRTRTLLIQSQACCQLHQGAPISDGPINRNLDYSSTNILDQPRQPHAGASYIAGRDTTNSISDYRLHPSRLSLSAWLPRALAAAALIAGIASCSDTLLSAGPSPALAEARADQFFEAFATRFNGVEFAPKYEAARLRLAQSALVPSRIFNDTSVWESRPSPTLRLLYISGTTSGGHYRLDSYPTLAPALHVGDTRHSIALEQLAPSVYRWDTSVDLSIGSITAEHVSVLISALLRSPEGRAEHELRNDYRAAFPRAMAVLGRGFAVDTIRTGPGGAATTNVQLTLSFHPELMRPAYPAFAEYLDKYLGPAKYHFALADRAGAPLFDVVGRDRAVTIRYRLQQGKLTSLSGPPKPWPDSLLLTSDVSLKVKFFTVGFHSLLTDFVIANSGRDRNWTIVAQHEPKWDLPFVTERLIRSPLHRPFEDGGALFRLSVRDSVGMQSVLARRTRLDVQESAIMRFIGSLASHALGDLDAKVEVEEDRFIRDAFTALQGDVRGSVTRWRPETENATKP